jgi:hypothetical protein
MLEKHAQTIALAQAGIQASAAQAQGELAVLARYADLLKTSHVRVSGLVDRIIPALQAEIRRLS